MARVLDETYVEEVEAEAMVDQRSIFRYLLGLPVRPKTAARIADVVKRLGFPKINKPKGG